MQNIRIHNRPPNQPPGLLTPKQIASLLRALREGTLYIAEYPGMRYPDLRVNFSVLAFCPDLDEEEEE